MREKKGIQGVGMCARWRGLLAVLELVMQQDVKYFPFANFLVVDQVRFCTFILFTIVITENFAPPVDFQQTNLVKFVVLIVLGLTNSKSV